jgi:alpha-amylase
MKKRIWFIIGSVVAVVSILIGGLVYALNTWQTTNGTVTGSIVVTTFPASGGGGSDGVLNSISITPSTQVSLSVGATQQFTATGSYTVVGGNNFTKDITNDVTWSSSDTSVATVDANGLVKGIASKSTRTTNINCYIISGTTQKEVDATAVTVSVSNFAYTSDTNLDFGQTSIETGGVLGAGTQQYQAVINISNTGNVPIVGMIFTVSNLPSGFTLGPINVNMSTISVPAGNSIQLTIMLQGTAPSTAQTIDLSGIKWTLTPKE